MLVAKASDSECSSAPALEAAERNAELTGRKLLTVKGDALDVMKQMALDGRKFDVVIVDPPALIKRKRDHEGGLGLYGRLNRSAINLLTPRGVLVSCSCSHHLAPEELQRVLMRESGAAAKRPQILETLEQWPAPPAIPETRYFKAYIVTAINDQAV